VVAGNTSNLFRGSPLYWEQAQGIRLGQNELDFLSLNLRPICNYRCADCFSGMGNEQNLEGTLSWEETQTLISQARDLGVRAIEISGEGEPLMDIRNLRQIIRYNNDLGIITTVFTNGYLLNLEILEFFVENNVSLAISLDYINEEDYESDNCRQGSYQRVMQNINIARELFNQHISEDNGDFVHRLAIHSIASARNLDQIAGLADFCGDDVLYSVAPIANVGNAIDNPDMIQVSQEEIQDVVDKYSVGELILCQSSRDDHGSDLCGTFRYGLGIRHNGDVLFDAHAFETSGTLGNVRDVPLRELVSRQQEMREQFYERFGCTTFCPLREPRYQEFVQQLGVQNE